MDRERIYRVVGHRYKRFSFFGDSTCIYCGRDATTKDHVPAVVNSYCYNMSKYPHIVVPACRSCNSILGDKFKNTMLERVKHLAIRYEKKFEKVLSVPDWKEEEIAEMGPIMRRRIRHAMNQKLVAEFVLNHLLKVESLCYQRFVYKEDVGIC